MPSLETDDIKKRHRPPRGEAQPPLPLNYSLVIFIKGWLVQARQLQALDMLDDDMQLIEPCRGRGPLPWRCTWTEGWRRSLIEASIH